MAKKKQDTTKQARPPVQGSGASRTPGSTTSAVPRPSQEEPSMTQTSSKEPRERQPVPQPGHWSTGAWRGKATAVAEVAKDSISAAATTASERLPPSTSAQASRLSDKLRTPTKSGPTTKLSREDSREPRSESSSGRSRGSDGPKVMTTEKNKGTQEGAPQTIVTDGGEGDLQEEKERPLPAADWRGWWSRPSMTDGEKQGEGTPSDVSKGDPSGKRDQQVSTSRDGGLSHPSEAEQQPVPNGKLGNDAAQQPSGKNELAQTGKLIDPEDPTGGSAGQRSSWFGLWGVTQPTTNPAATTTQAIAPTESADSNLASDGYTALDDTNAEAPRPGPTTETAQREAQRSGTWAFWSREPANDSDSTQHKKTNSKSEEGELAIARTSTENKPQPARMKEPQASSSGTSTPASSIAESGKANDTTQEPKAIKKTRREPSLADSILRTTIPSDDASKYGSDGDNESLKAEAKKLRPQNLLLPSLEETLPFEETPSYMQSMWRMFGRAQQESQRHLSLTHNPPKIRKAVAIGVHGYFPTPLVQKVIGQPTGTSLKFANMAAASITTWTSHHQPSIPIEIEKIALEGEGMITHRVSTLWKLLLNFTPALSSADLILIAAHSQGVPVAIMLLASLLDLGILKSNVRLAVCGMAGINLGPFASYQSRILGSGSANELFDFARPDSAVSRAYAEALATCLADGVRIMFVGSIDDQLVSLESSLLATVSHPGVYRAVFVDGRIHAPGFVTSLVGLAVKLRNLGSSDHGLLRELSAPLAGSLYTGEGHSRIYEDEAMYLLALDFGLRSSRSRSGVGTVVTEKPQVATYEPPNAGNANPYLLPWALRGILGEEIVRTRLRAEVEALRIAFEEWRPSSKVLRDVKVRLEGLRARL